MIFGLGCHLQLLSTAGLAAHYLLSCRLAVRRPGRTRSWSIALFTLPTMQFQAISAIQDTLPPATDPVVVGRRVTSCPKASEGDFFANRQARRRAARFTIKAFAALRVCPSLILISATFVLVPAAQLSLFNEKHLPRRSGERPCSPRSFSAAASLRCSSFTNVLPSLWQRSRDGDYKFTFESNIATEAARRLGPYLSDAAYLRAGLEILMHVALIGLAGLIGLVYLIVRIVLRSHHRDRRPDQFCYGLRVVRCRYRSAAGCHHLAQTYRVLFTMTAIVMLALFWLLKQLLVGGIRVAAIIAAVGLVF